MDGEVDPADVVALQADEDVECCIVDIRNPRQFERGHIPGSLNVPMAELTGRIESLPEADRIVTVCPHGKASVQAARLIKSYEGVGAPVESMAGGLTAYDGPLQTGDSNAEHAEDRSNGDRTQPSADSPDAPF